jgi:spore germination protein PA
MPAIVGAVQVMSIGSSGVFHIGDVFKISPASTTKTFAGGSFNTGDLSLYNNQSSTNTYDGDLTDQPILLNV